MKQHNLNVKVVIINNKFLGMVKQWQDLFFDKRYASTSIPAQPDFVKLAEAYGIKGFRAETPKDATKTLEEVFRIKEPCVVDLVVDPEEHVYPMVPAGGSTKDIVLSKVQEQEILLAEVKPRAARSKGGRK
jgi:acetolactate synthase-1/2/3 large subunit